MPSEWIPKPGEWPIDPQEDVPIQDSRVWIDGCFDFSHHGHAGAMLQARRLGTELVVGVHSDEAILENKGPTVMTLDERMAAVCANRWTTFAVPRAPYVTSLPWISHYGCRYVVHGDDITSDAGGEDCYRFVKKAGRFKVVKRTPSISTTDLVGRMLLCTRSHFLRDFEACIAAVLPEIQHPSKDVTKEVIVEDAAMVKEPEPTAPEEDDAVVAERKRRGEEMMARFRDYATDQTGVQPGVEVWMWRGGEQDKHRRPSMSRRRTSGLSRRHSSGAGDSSRNNTQVSGEHDGSHHHHHHHHHTEHRHKHSSSKETNMPSELFSRMVEGKRPRPGQRIVYVDGGFDLFSSGHIEFLRLVTETEEKAAREQGWYEGDSLKAQLDELGEPYDPFYVVVGVHGDEVINRWKGVNYPVMNIFERALCALQCKYVHAMVLLAPYTPSDRFLKTFPFSNMAKQPEPPDVVYHGPTSFLPHPPTFDTYAAAKALGIYNEIPEHPYSHVNAGEIVNRILKGREAYEARQKKKGEKGMVEDAVKRREELEREAEAERERRRKEVEGQFGV
ncbi:hypothetical protein BDY21DRAFT_383424 [Lineolata rhizophorae]|uniref:ethanolamine-phosphate cytidylyltransferase n=1 Tax=Lineolata rhizophorae TaxID=578093 RepID=A0A6A6PBP8_9PEZI|nr:hypothetical protein BDY21DRAFT_383424 [Lineolata rhizophorae]